MAIDTVPSGANLVMLAPRPGNIVGKDAVVTFGATGIVVHLDRRSSSPEEVHQHSRFFANAPDLWYKSVNPRNVPTVDFAPQACTIPRITLTPGLSQFWDEGEGDTPNPGGFVFIAVVQGAAVAAVARIITTSCRFQMGAAIFNAGLNGFSVTFTGAVLGVDGELRRDGLLITEWKRVVTFEQLHLLAAENAGTRGGVCGILC